MKIKIFSSGSRKIETFETEVNDWLQANSSARIISIQTSASATSDDSYCSEELYIVIVYEDVT